MRLTFLLRNVLFGLAMAFAFGIASPAHAQLTRVGWTSIVSSQSGECLDVAGESTQAGAAVVQWPCQSTQNEAWVLIPAPTGGFFVMEQQTTLCLGTSQGSVVQGACSGTGTVWNVATSGSGLRLSSPVTGLCMATAGDSLASNAPIVMASCTDPKLTSWVFQSGLVMPTQIMTLQANDSGQCMISASASGGASQIVQNTCAGTPPEQWRLAPLPNSNGYSVALGASGLCLTAPSATSGAHLASASCARSASQTFLFLPGASGYMVNLSGTPFCVADSGSTAAPGTALVLANCASVPAEEWSLTPAAAPASWTGVIPLSTDPIAVANLPNGTLLTWSASDLYSYEWDIGTYAGQTYYSMFNPTTLSSGPAMTSTAGADMFCPGIAMLANGQILVNGGSSSPRTTLFNPLTGLFTTDANMNVPRGYEGDTLLSNGSVLTLGGSWSGGVGNKTGETWTQGAGWTLLSGVPETNIIGPDPAGVNRGDNHLWLFALSQGRLLHAGPSANMNWITTSGAGSITPAGTRGDDAYSINGDAVMYDVGKILKAGGAPAYDEGIATTSAYNISTNPSLTVTKLAPMAYARSFGSGVALPNGQVLIVGGQTIGEGFTDTGAVLIPELWDPQTNVFAQLPPMQTPRTYHSTAILLNDGRVFVGGGGQCGQGCAANHFNTEVLTPPYLLNADGSSATRPVITSAPANAPPGSSFVVTTDSPVVSFALMRNSAITHTVNNDQRRIPLHPLVAVPTSTGFAYGLGIPADTGVALPGNYMLFAINANGVPSVAASMLVH